MPECGMRNAECRNAGMAANAPGRMPNAGMPKKKRKKINIRSYPDSNWGHNSQSVV